MGFIEKLARFVAHKILTYGLRENPAKIQKDAYYAYYVLRFHPDGENLLKEIAALELKKEKKIIQKNLKNDFGTLSSAGILRVEREVGRQNYPGDIRKDIFEKFQVVREIFSAK